ncbi:MAG: cytochrome-c oxidase, cbb3-type subunit III [Nitrospinota bacterium]|nr:cytochrome-c oxidase, cbb3-type subunit III [Nitrospinota bacterium]
MSGAEKNPFQGEDTGHEWDGIRELKNDPPRWWMISLYLSGIWMIAYFLLYPSIPLISSHTKGLLGWTSINEYKEDMAEVAAVRAPFEQKIKNMSAKAILNDQEMAQFAIASSKVLFGDNCAPCHGAAGEGTSIFPILIDDVWLYGGDINDIVQSIAEGRQGNMPGFKDDLSETELNDVVKYVEGLASGNIYEPGQKVFRGESEAEAGCADCHGVDAKGSKDVGAPNLSDNIWRFGSSTEDIRLTILHGVNQEGDPKTRSADMPSFGDKLSETQINKLAVKVYLFGGGQ